MSQDLLRIIDSICRDKNIDRESFVADLENAMSSAIRKAHEDAEAAEVRLDPLNGKISATVDGKPIDVQLLWADCRPDGQAGNHPEDARA
jgi:N utilization substance protein A